MDLNVIYWRIANWIMGHRLEAVLLIIGLGILIFYLGIWVSEIKEDIENYLKEHNLLNIFYLGVMILLSIVLVILLK